MNTRSYNLAALFAVSFLALIAILAHYDVLSGKQMQTVVLFGPILIVTMLQSRRTCRRNRLQDAS
ncbi:MAG: hypothetical protein HKO05_04335 [Erythrobacter sp.]|nr:hypothetical protein [Erythrobacter sp.]RZV29447.1 MAG: hypothetical protein EX262_09930 [Sphingomonadaceae bacterium]